MSYIYMDLSLATLKSVFFYLPHNVAQLCVNILLATKVTLIIDGI
jgi:hypothetical protein